MPVGQTINEKLYSSRPLSVNLLKKNSNPRPEGTCLGFPNEFFLYVWSVYKLNIISLKIG